MVLFLNQEFVDYIKDNYSIDLEEDENITVKNYNPNICLARVWKSDEKYQYNAGGFSNFQCRYRPFNGKIFCECHNNQLLPFGRIDEDKPKEPVIIDMLGNSKRYFWIEDSEGLLNDFYSQDNKERTSEEKRCRGRPPAKRLDYNSIDWLDSCKTNEIYNFTLDVLKKFLKDKNLDHYGRKENIIKRIKETLKFHDDNINIKSKQIIIDNVEYSFDGSNIIDISGKTLGLYIRQIKNIQFQDSECKQIHERNKINVN